MRGRELLWLVASIRGGRLTAKEALDKLGSAAKGDALHAAADELGKLLRTIFFCDYFTTSPSPTSAGNCTRC